MQYTAIFHGCKIVHFQMIFFLNIFLIFAQNIDCDLDEYPQSMFSSKNKKKVCPRKPQFYYIKVRFKGLFVLRTCFRDAIKVSMVFLKLFCPSSLQHISAMPVYSSFPFRRPCVFGWPSYPVFSLIPH